MSCLREMGEDEELVCGTSVGLDAVDAVVHPALKRLGNFDDKKARLVDRMERESSTWWSLVAEYERKNFFGIVGLLANLASLPATLQIDMAVGLVLELEGLKWVVFVMFVDKVVTVVVTDIVAWRKVTRSVALRFLETSRDNTRLRP